MPNPAVGLLASFLVLAPAFAQDAKPDIPDPECDGGTADMVRCIDAVTAQWDERLNAAYREALKDAATREQSEQLRKAQRLWVQYRDASCLFEMTKARAQELERGPEN